MFELLLISRQGATRSLRMKSGAYFVVLFLWCCFPTAVLSQIDGISRESLDSAGVEADQASSHCVVSENGALIAFRSRATNLVERDTNNVADVFYRDTDKNTTIRIENNSGTQGNGESGVLGSSGKPIGMSSDGNHVTFASAATNFDLSMTDTNQSVDIFLYNASDNTLTRRSLAFSVLEGSGDCFSPSVSDDASIIPFSSEASDFVSFDNNSVSDALFRDANGAGGSGETKLASLASGESSGNGESLEPVVSRDAKFIAFSSAATDLVTDDTNLFQDIFVFDVVAATVSRITVSGAGVEANGASSQPSISEDGRYVAFRSEATNLVENDTNGVADIFIHDRTLGSTKIVSLGRKGGPANGESFYPTVSDDGRFVSFLSKAKNLVQGDLNEVTDAFVRDISLAANFRLNLSSSGVESKLEVLDASISPDGKFACFSSADSTLVADDVNSVSDVFLVKLAGIVTPDTPIADPPEVSVEGNSVTIVMQKFSRASLKQTQTSPARSVLLEPARRRRLTIRYEVTAQGSDAIAEERRRKISKRNQITLKNLPPGSYTTGYKVRIKRGRTTVGETGTSPSAGFTVGSGG